MQRFDCAINSPSFILPDEDEEAASLASSSDDSTTPWTSSTPSSTSTSTTTTTSTSSPSPSNITSIAHSTCHCASTPEHSQLYSYPQKETVCLNDSSMFSKSAAQHNEKRILANTDHDAAADVGTCMHKEGTHISQLHTPLPAGGKASLTTSIFNLTCNLIGAGMLTLPWCFRQTSFLTGILILVAVCCLNCISFLLLTKCCIMAQSYSYLHIGTLTLGYRFGQLIQFIMLCYTYLSALSYVILIGDFIPSALYGLKHGLWGLDPDFCRFWVIVAIAVLVLLPLSFVKNLYSLRYNSIIALTFILYSVVLICSSAIGGSKLDHADPPSNGVFSSSSSSSSSAPPSSSSSSSSWSSGNNNNNSSSSTDTGGTSFHFFEFTICAWRAIPIMNVAFTAHYNLPRLYEELASRSYVRMRLIIFTSLCLTLVLYLLMGMGGYARFRSATEGDVLNNLPDEYIAGILCKLGLSIAISLSYPLCFHPIRHSFFALLFPHLNEAHNQTLKSIPFVFWNTALVVGTVILGILLRDIENVIAYKGSLFGSLIVYTFPAIMYLLLLRKQKKRQLQQQQQQQLEEGYLKLDDGLDDATASAAVSQENSINQDQREQHDDGGDETCQINIKHPSHQQQQILPSEFPIIVKPSSTRSKQVTPIDAHFSDATTTMKAPLLAESYLQSEADPPSQMNTADTSRPSDPSSQTQQAETLLDPAWYKPVALVLFVWGICMGISGSIVNALAQSGYLKQCP